MNKTQVFTLGTGLAIMWLFYRFSLEVWCWAYGLLY